MSSLLPSEGTKSFLCCIHFSVLLLKNTGFNMKTTIEKTYSATTHSSNLKKKYYRVIVKTKNKKENYLIFCCWMYLSKIITSCSLQYLCLQGYFPLWLASVGYSSQRTASLSLAQQLGYQERHQVSQGKEYEAAQLGDFMQNCSVLPGGWCYSCHNLKR